jgi:hypothetical protein
MGIAVQSRRRWWQRIAQAAAPGAVLLFGVADAGANTERVRPYEIAGPAGLGSDEALCRRLAAALNAEGRRKLTAPRTDSMFARWQEVQHPDSREIIHEATRADILNEGNRRTVYRITDLYSFDKSTQSLVFMRDESQSLPLRQRTGQPSTWAEAVESGRMFAITNFLTWSSSPTLSDFLRQYPTLKTPAGRRFRMPGYSQATDLILLDGRQTLALIEDTNLHFAVLIKIQGTQSKPVCYLS